MDDLANGEIDALQSLLEGLIHVLVRRDALSQEDLRLIFDAAITANELAGDQPRNHVARLALERISLQFLPSPAGKSP